MSTELVSITATVRLHQCGEYVDAYVLTTGGTPYCIASLAMNMDNCTAAWREEFRSLCKHVVEESFGARGFRPIWLDPQPVVTE